MALTKGVNSYVTVAEADTYFADRLDVVLWINATADRKAQALITATGVLDDQPWTGTAVSDDQPLAFPRSGSYFDPRMGVGVNFDEDITPIRITNATMELALHLITNNNLQDDTGSARHLLVGPIHLQHISAANLIPARVRRGIIPMLINGGARTWWRAN